MKLYSTCLIGVAIFSLSLLTQCKGRNPNTLPNDFEEIPLSEYKYEPSAIKSGTAVSILAFSGAKSKEGKKMYYSQFIVLDKATGDTTRVLSTLISTDSAAGSSSEIYEPTDQFDGGAGVHEAVFELPSDNQNMMTNLLANLPSDVKDVKDINDAMADSVGRKDYVLVNRSADIFSRKYKTSVGVLRFHDRPW